MTQSSPESLGNVIDALMHQLGMQTKLKQYRYRGLMAFDCRRTDRKYDGRR